MTTTRARGPVQAWEVGVMAKEGGGHGPLLTRSVLGGRTCLDPRSGVQGSSGTGPYLCSLCVAIRSKPLGCDPKAYAWPL